MPHGRHKHWPDDVRFLVRAARLSRRDTARSLSQSSASRDHRAGYLARDGFYPAFERNCPASPDWPAFALWLLIRAEVQTFLPAAIAWRGSPRSCATSIGVAIVGSIDELLSQVDVVLLESVDGRPHLEQARPVFQAHKPVFIDKPVAGSLADAIAIFDLARETGTPCFSSSSLRFSPGVSPMRANRQDRRRGRL